MFQNKRYYWIFITVLSLISHFDGVTGLVIKAPELATTKAKCKVPSAPSSPLLCSSTSLGLSSYDADYYVPTEQHSISGEQSRITLSRFLSQYVKDHPEVSAIFEYLIGGCTIANTTPQKPSNFVMLGYVHWVFASPLTRFALLLPTGS